MEVAGVVLGAVPLIFYALDNYHRAWEPLRDTKNWKETIVTIRTQVQLQREQLKATLFAISFELTDVTTMDEIQYAFSISHPNNVETFMSSIRQMDALMNDLAKDLYPDVQGPPRMADAKSDRMTWEWRRVKRSFGSKRRKEIYTQLQACNNALRNCGLEKREAQPDTENRIINYIKARFDEKTTKTIRENARTLHQGIKAGLGCACLTPQHLGHFQLNWHENKPVRNNKFVLAMSSTLPKPDPSVDDTLSWKFLAVAVEEEKPTSEVTVGPSPSSLPLSPTSSQASTLVPPAKSKGVRFREFFRSDSKSSISSTGSTISTLTTSSTTITSAASIIVPSRTPSPQPHTGLCDVLQDIKSFDSTSMPVPKSQPSKFIRVSPLGPSDALNPADIKNTIQLHALLDRAVDNATNRRFGLDRKKRFGIATALVWAVLHLCDSPWLEEVVQGDAIHLFLEQDGHDLPHLSSHPYLSHKFDPSTGTGDKSSPTAQFQKRQIQNITLYTLAIRLIELGANKSFERLRREHNTSFPSRADATTPLDDYDVAKWQIEELSLDPGPSYAGAVEKCLRFIFPGPTAMHTFEHKSFRSTFFDYVIAPIQATYELIPASYSQIVF